MKTGYVVLTVVAVALVALVGGFILGRSNISVLAGILPASGSASSQPSGGPFAPGQFQPGPFDPSQMTEEQRQAFRQGRGQGQAAQLPMGPESGAAFGGARFGAIESIEDGVMVVRQADGSALKVKTTDTTLIQKLMDVGLADLVVGESVAVSGSAGEDGVTTARSIRVMGEVTR
ncbi:MAG: hypothetical protein GX605_14240 [Chloroflexi bacterium]|nr:hypothetical protein [Chloroflexota bacterium]